MSHYYSEKQNVDSSEKKHIVKINNIVFEFITDNGVFSKKGLDFGTRTLLESIDTQEINGNVLDMGCGYGPIGIYISKLTSSVVDMVDINERSLNLSRKNASLNKVKVNIKYSDKYSDIEKKYNFIITNPPIRVGKEILYSILFDAKQYLVPGGKLFLVINKDQGAKSLIKDLEKVYFVDIVSKNKGFYVISATNN